MKKNLISKLPLTIVGALILGLGLLWSTEAQTLAFPGAEGYGRFAKGGRGGRIIEVTNLNNSGPGSLREAVEAEGPRIVVFRVSGTIDLELQDLDILNDYITIAGQTAPGDGIALKRGGIATRSAKHVIVRHLRVRPGSDSYKELGRNANGIGVWSHGDLKPGIRSENVIFDHMSVSWCTDDLAYVIYGSDSITIQWSIFSEGFFDCGPECGGKGFLMGYGARSVSFHHNLSAHNWIRWPEVTGGGSDAAAIGRLDFVNNVQYNGNGTDVFINPLHGPIYSNFVGNVFKDGLDTEPSKQGYAVIRAIGGLIYSSQAGIYVDDNIGRHWENGGESAPEGPAVPDNSIIWGDNGGIQKETSRYNYPLINTATAQQAYVDVLDAAGATRPERDVVDQRVVNDVKNNTGHWINDPSEVGGWPKLASATPPTDTDHDGMPDSWETSNGFNPSNASDGPQDKDGDGYTNVEEYLNELAGNNPKTAVSPAKPNSVSKSIASRKVKQCPLDIFGRTISENSKNSKKQSLTREIVGRKLGKMK